MNVSEAIEITPTVEVETKALAIPEKANLIVVTDNDSMTIADNTKSAIKDMIKEINSVFEPIAKKAFEAHRAITGKWKEVKQPLEDADSYLTGQVKGYLRKLEEVRLEEERRLREIARKQEEERRLAEALQAEQEGNTAEAQAILDEEVFVIAPVVKSDAPKVDNRKYRTIPRARCTDIMKLIRFVANNPALADLLEVNQSALNNKAKAMGAQISNIPGLSYYEE